MQVDGWVADQGKSDKMQVLGRRERMEAQTGQQPVQIAITVPLDDQDEVAGWLRDGGVVFHAVSSQGFDGSHTIDLLVNLTPALAAILAGVYAKQIHANRYISFKYKGIEVKGVSEEALIKIIERTRGRGNRS
jgi:hypothetical protein